MPETLGLVVTSNRRPRHVVGLARAARDRGLEVLIFLTGRGVFLTRDPEFAELAALAEIRLCAAGYRSFGLDPDEPVPGLTPDSFSTQAFHGELIRRSDHYVVL